MRVLALDTATAATAVAVVSFDGDDGGRPRSLAERRHVDPRAHGELLAPMVRQVLDAAGVGGGQLAAIVAGDGPGPFTGLRVGLATAAAMAQAWGVVAYGVCSLDGIGAATTGGPVLVATDARRREIYWALYTDGARLAGPAVGRPADVAPVLAARGVRQGYGEGALHYREVLGVPVAEDPVYPDPVVLAGVAYQRVASGAPGDPLTPRYLRRADTAAPGRYRPVTR